MKKYEKPSITIEALVAEEPIAANESYLGGVDPLADFGEEVSIPAGSGDYWD